MFVPAITPCYLHCMTPCWKSCRNSSARHLCRGTDTNSSFPTFPLSKPVCFRFLAGESWRLKVFAENGDIYCASATAMFHVPVEKTTGRTPSQAERQNRRTRPRIRRIGGRSQVDGRFGDGSCRGGTAAPGGRLAHLQSEHRAALVGCGQCSEKPPSASGWTQRHTASGSVIAAGCCSSFCLPAGSSAM